MAVDSSSDAPIAFLNGKQMPFREVRLPVYDLGLMQGATLTERLRTVRHQPYLVEEHLDRLFRSLAVVGWNVSLDRDALTHSIHHLATINSKGIGAGSDLAIVIFITAGQALTDANGEIDLSSPTVCLYTAPLPFRRWAGAYQGGIPLVIPAIRQLPADVLSPSIKHRSRLHWALADQQARSVDASGVALLLDQQGFVTETSSGNFFIVRDSTLLTPPLEMTLPGIAQAHLMHLAKKQGFPVERASLTPDMVMGAEEAFLTSSTYCLLPVSQIDGKKIGTQVPGTVTRLLTAAWSKEIGLNFAQQAHQQG